MPTERGPRTENQGPTTDDRRLTTDGGRRVDTSAGRSSLVLGRSSAAAPGRSLTLLASFGHAFRGIGHLVATQRNAQIHCALAVAAAALGFGLRIERGEWLALILTIALVLAAEGVNTAVESTVDLAAPGYHPLAKVAKDVAAGTVLLTAIAAVIVGAVIFLPRLWPIAVQILGTHR
ncbi:MAG TPA: diacylglycerol kinase family protein [Roseiflexaceae bacterium]|nr:diacylglycerol kinase family protein [Roseiflexaceae bacterium]